VIGTKRWEGKRCRKKFAKKIFRTTTKGRKKFENDCFGVLGLGKPKVEGEGP